MNNCTEAEVSKVEKVSQITNKIMEIIIIILVAVMLFITTIEVFSRNVLQSSFNWGEELTRFTLVGITFLGASVVYKRGELIAINAFTKLEMKKRKIIFYITQSILIIFTLVLIYYSAHTATLTSTVRQSSPGLNISMAIPYLTIPIGLFAMLIHQINFFINPADLFSKEEEYEA